ncbi:Transcriptional regulatory protein tctD [compost metagenome]|jgi:two-component system, OmpR family, response regulator TctD|uniref:Transcriptional regulatory protein TctD n=1 Tax=Cupriavidus necator (strain ATCC 43291 / DSM 13513 / CCUG 52238 / LMG 8453 / N-1) TaxID=1042878 RepID=G0F0J3_CUPNN|nr:MULTISPECIES: response regulator [Cupriavidus]AEI77622.1 transcriptional regulatory protein TctD [Cupriavidus necator N-1]KAI3598310.1 Tricarboxylate transport transcriptional regulator TctD [Cupriavidus necator H850]MDX6013843.1 response regulator [Cupriavidus necator]QUN27094.1 response regulator [Cupriavidus sp. KK10]
MRILLAEDNVMLANSLSQALGQAGFTVDCMHDGRSADNLLSTQDYALLILDLGLPGLDGLEVLRRLRQRRNPLPVLILTAHGSVEDRVRGLDLGADDYLAKPFDLSELEARARALIRRAHGHESTQIACGPLHYDSVSRAVLLHGELLPLTGRERAVLEVLLLRDGRAVNKAALSEKIFGIDESVNPDAIEIYVHRLRKKLDGSGVAIVTLRGLGYLLEARPVA